MGYAQAIVAVAALGYQIYAGEDQKRRQALNESRQGQAQKRAEAAAVAAKRSAEEDVARAGRKKPDVGALLAAAQEGRNLGSASTLLTTGGGDKARLSAPTLLGS